MEDIIDGKILYKILLDYKTNPNSQIKNVKWTTNENFPEQGQGNFSQGYKLVIEYEEDDTPRKKFLFLKVPSHSPQYKFGLKYNLFIKEVLIYTEILPQMHTIGEVHLSPRFYHSDDKYSLYLKDLSKSGYRVANHPKQLDFQHCFHVFQCLAKFHAFSIKIDKTANKISRKFQVDGFGDVISNTDALKIWFSSKHGEFFDNLQPDIRTMYAEQIDFFKNLNWSDIVADVTPREDQFNVLNHGDLWFVNILFKYDKFGTIKKTKFIDFQLSRWTSPAIDLIYFAITSMNFEVFVQHFDLLLRIYTETLNEILTTFNCATYPIEHLKNDIRKRGCYAIFILARFLPYFILKYENSVDEDLTKNQLDSNTPRQDILTKWFLHYAQNIDKFQFGDK